MATAVFGITVGAAGTLVSCAQVAAGAGAKLTGPLATDGTALVDEGNGGALVGLHGVDVLATSGGPYPNGFVDPSALTTLEAWGVNFVRLEISSDAYLEQCLGESYDSAYGTDLSQAVQELTSNGIFVLIDIHATNPDCLWSSGQESGVVPLPGYDVVSTMSSLVSRYGTNPLVGYEPFNEPEGCAMGTTGPAASQFVPLLSEPNRACPSAKVADLAWDNPGTAIVGGVQLLGTVVGGRRYGTPGMVQIYQTIEHSLPAGAPQPLVFLDANGWAAMPVTFDAMGPALSAATNVVQVFHPYDCQDRGSGTGECDEAAPEACSVVTSHVSSFLSDPATGRAWSKPVVFDEFDFPANERGYDYSVSTALGQAQVPIVMYQHGLWVNNAIASMQSAGVPGWALYFFQNADNDPEATPYSMTPSGTSSSTPVPWAPNANAAPAVQAMQGARLSCQNPPPGFG